MHRSKSFKTYWNCNNVICSCIDDDDLIQSTVIIGILVAFGKLSLEALRIAFEMKIIFMFFLIFDLIGKDSRVSFFQLSIMLLKVKNIQMFKEESGKIEREKEMDSTISWPFYSTIDDRQIWFLFLVFVSMYLPELVTNEKSQFLSTSESTFSLLLIQLYYVVHIYLYVHG